MHGSLDQKEFKLNINGVDFTSQSAEILESITRSSIKRFLNLLKDSPKRKNKILSDKGVVTRTDYHKLMNENTTVITAAKDLAQMLETLDGDFSKHIEICPERGRWVVPSHLVLSK